MRVFVIAFLLGLVHLSYSQHKIEKAQFSLGEERNYKIKYGWFKIGEAVFKVDSQLHYLNNEPHYNVRFSFKTQGLVALFSNLNLNWDSYISANTNRPFKSVQTVSNGKRVNFYYDEYSYADSIYVQSWKNQNKKSKFSFRETEKPFVDALGTYLYARSISLDMSRSVDMQLYYSKKVYDFGIIPDKGLLKKNDKRRKSYAIRLPDIEEFDVGKQSYVIFRNSGNVIEELKLATSDGNIYLILEE